MATVGELIARYDDDPALQQEVADILSDGKVTISKFMAFAKKYDVNVSLRDLPKYLDEAKNLGLVE